MIQPAHLVLLREAGVAHLVPGSFEEEAALESIDAAREDELAARDTDRQRRDWQRRVAKSVRERRG